MLETKKMTVEMIINITNEKNLKTVLDISKSFCIY